MLYTTKNMLVELRAELALKPDGAAAQGNYTNDDTKQQLMAVAWTTNGL